MDFSLSYFESDVFEKVRYYLKEQEWKDAYINRIILDSRDVELNVFFKSRGQTFMKTFNRADFENLVMAACNNMFKVSIQLDSYAEDTVNYRFYLNKEVAVQR